MQITDLAKEQKIPVLLRLAFRPLFLGAALFAVLAIGWWGAILAGWLQQKPALPLVFWHSHEMVFGFGSAVVAGFLLTAMQNWTGLRAPHGRPLALLVGCWLLARLANAAPVQLPLPFLMLLDLSFLPLAAWLLARPLIAAQQYRNLFFIPLLLVLTICNALMWLGLMPGYDQFQQHGSTSAVLLITMVMAIVGGRVLPMFTANGTRTTRVSPLLWLDRAALGSCWLVFGYHFFHLQLWLPAQVPLILCSLAALLLAVRALRWKIWITLREPLLWSLHIAYWCIPAGLALFAARYAGFAVTQSLAIHLLTVGAMGGMILSMMSRVSLGHTGRPLKVPRWMPLAFVSLIAAVVSRVALPMVSGMWYQTGVLLSALFWVCGFSLFLLCYWNILTSPRADGHPG
jgi:uncharacterized protein involved in response to NO